MWFRWCVAGVVGVFALDPEKVQSLLLSGKSSSSLQRQQRCFSPRINMSQAEQGVELTEDVMHDCCRSIGSVQRSVRVCCVRQVLPLGCFLLVFRGACRCVVAT